MTSHFLKSYVANLKNLSIEMNRNQKLVILVNDNIKSLTVEVQQKFQQLFADVTKKQRFHEDPALCSQIKIIYLLIRQIQKSEAVKRSLTRSSCDILDKYLATLDENVNSATANHRNDDHHASELLQTLKSIKLHLNQPVQGNAVIVDLIKKMENGREVAANADDVTNKVEVLSSVQNMKNSTSEDMAEKAKSNVSHLIHKMDNLQVFTDKIIDICLEMKSRHKIEQPSNVDVQTTTEDEESTEEDAELCHCRTQYVGQMVACDNTKCKTRWYHFECVGLYKIPEGLWYCPSCLIFDNATT